MARLLEDTRWAGEYHGGRSVEYRRPANGASLLALQPVEEAVEVQDVATG